MNIKGEHEWVSIGDKRDDLLAEYESDYIWLNVSANVWFKVTNAVRRVTPESKFTLVLYGMNIGHLKFEDEDIISGLTDNNEPVYICIDTADVDRPKYLDSSLVQPMRPTYSLQKIIEQLNENRKA